MPVTKKALSQWSVWPPALAVIVALVLVGWAVQHWLSHAWQIVYLLSLPLPGWWLLPRLAFQLWLADGRLQWRWGQGNLGRAGSLLLDDIVSVEVATLPDQPRRPYREFADGEAHGGSFNPRFNRGIKVLSRDGRVHWFCLPKPDEFADALRTALPVSLPESP